MYITYQKTVSGFLVSGINMLGSKSQDLVHSLILLQLLILVIIPLLFGLMIVHSVVEKLKHPVGHLQLHTTRVYCNGVTSSEGWTRGLRWTAVSCVGFDMRHQAEHPLHNSCAVGYSKVWQRKNSNLAEGRLILVILNRDSNWTSMPILLHGSPEANWVLRNLLKHNILLIWDHSGCGKIHFWIFLTRRGIPGLMHAHCEKSKINAIKIILKTCTKQSIKNF